jgi:hypothetical protein
MRNAIRIFLLAVALVMIVNFIILRLYGDTLQSTHLFIVRSTVFYPVAWLNLLLGTVLAISTIWEWVIHKRHPE